MKYEIDILLTNGDPLTVTVTACSDKPSVLWKLADVDEDVYLPMATDFNAAFNANISEDTATNDRHLTAFYLAEHIRMRLADRYVSLCDGDSFEVSMLLDTDTDTFHLTAAGMSTNTSDEDWYSYAESISARKCLGELIFKRYGDIMSLNEIADGFHNAIAEICRSEVSVVESIKPTGYSTMFDQLEVDDKLLVNKTEYGFKMYIVPIMISAIISSILSSAIMILFN